MTQAVNQTPGPPVDERRAHRWLRRLFAARCLVCEERGDDGRALCAACAAALPWSGPACARCAVPLAAGDALCGGCLHRPPPLDATYAAFVYGFPVDRLLPRLKFHRDLAAGALLSASMARALASRPRPDALVPVPLHPARLRTRGYDQALELARPLSRALALPLRADLLRRQRATAPQSRLDAPARRRNVRDAFVATARGALPAHVALVDDVMTTGATLHAAALALRRLGIARVDAWVCARVP
ncbi:double zinc ribbon domain-containing protein [Luteimonas sp. gir]|uniref:ComF family protein n=1 Tax=Luteimonas sp. gir TaxID=3127960 RepID=UPI003075B7DB